MRTGHRLVILLAGLAAAHVSAAQGIEAVGSRSTEAVCAAWAKAFRDAGGSPLRYLAAGPNDILRTVAKGTADVGFSEVPFAPQRLAAEQLIQFPTVVSGVVPVANVPGIVPGALKLTGRVLADIFLGVVEWWDAPAIVGLNPELELPHRRILVRYPPGASTYTYVFTSYLAAVSPVWRARLGAGLSISWPTGEAWGEAGAVTAVLKTLGSISFADYPLASDQRLPMIQLRNRAGEFVTPNVISFQSAASAAPWESVGAFAVLPLDLPCRSCWPITAPIFALMPRQPADAGRAREALRFFHWTFERGDQIAFDAGFVALPRPVARLVEDAWKRQIKDRAGTPVWSAPEPK